MQHITFDNLPQRPFGSLTVVVSTVYVGFLD